MKNLHRNNILQWNMVAKLGFDRNFECLTGWVQMNGLPIIQNMAYFWVLCKSYERISHWLGLDDLLATSKLTKVKIFHTSLHKTIRHRPNFVLLGVQSFGLNLYLILVVPYEIPLFCDFENTIICLKISASFLSENTV